MLIKILLSLLLSSLLATNTQVKAQAVVPNTAVNPEAAQEKIEQKKQEVQEARIQVQQQVQDAQEQAQDAREEAQQTRRQVRAQIIENTANRLELRFDFYYLRLRRLSDKLEELIEKYTQEGYDLSAATKQLGAARTSLEKAYTLGKEAIAEFKSINPSDYQQQRNQALAAKDIALEARETFREALSLFKETAQIIRDTVIDDAEPEL